MKIESKHVDCTEMFVDEVSIGLFKKDAVWNGLTKIKRLKDDEYMIIGSTNGITFPKLFGDIFGDGHEKQTYVVGCSGFLAKEINNIVGANGDKIRNRDLAQCLTGYWDSRY